MSEENWKTRIVQAILEEDQAEPGRSGETPLTGIANEFERLPLTEASGAGDAIVGLLVAPTPTAKTHPNLYWRSLTFISQYLPHPEKRKLARAFHRQLFSKETFCDSIKADLLNGVIAMSGRLSPKELRDLETIRNTNPVSWLNAAVASEFYDLVRKEAVEALRCNRLDINSLILSLDGWREAWRGTDFRIVISEFYKAAEQGTPKHKLHAWMERRGFDDPVLAATSIGGVDDFIHNLSPSAWRGRPQLVIA